MDAVTVDGPGTMGRALVVDDLPGAREIIGEQLCGVGFTVVYAEDGLDAFDLFVREAPGLIVTDWQMPRLNGVGLVRRIREISDVPVVMLTAFGSIRDCEEAMRVGVDRYLQSGRDLQRVGEVACELMKDRIAKAKRGGIAQTPRVRESAAGRFSLGGAEWTAAEARSLAQQELREELQKHLFECRGNVSEMARRMGKDRSTIRYHLRRFGMLDSTTSRSTRAESPDSRSSKDS
jgi:DNA-binding NtrC family response regulator